MAAPESTKFQINYKLNDGTLINLYASSTQELESGLADLGMVAALIKSTANDLGGYIAPAAAPVAAASKQSAVETIHNAFPSATPVESAPNCHHGAMSFRSGQGAKGPWKGWMCAAPKGAPDKCDTVWVR
jgi:hypothetical protein